MSQPFFVHGMGWALPGNVLDDEFLHDEVGLEKGLDWNRSRLGIHKRYSVLSRDYIRETKNKNPMAAVAHARALGDTPVTMAVRAAQRALAHTSVKPEQIGMVVANNDLAPVKDDKPAAAASSGKTESKAAKTDK